MYALRVCSIGFLVPLAAAASPILFGPKQVTIDLEARVSVWGTDVLCNSGGAPCAVDYTTPAPPPFGSAWATADTGSVAASAHSGEGSSAYACASVTTIQSLVFLGAMGAGTAVFEVEGMLAGSLPGNAAFSLNGETLYETGHAVTFPVTFNEPFTLVSEQVLIVSAWPGEGGISRGDAYIANITAYDSSGDPVNTPEPRTLWTGLLIACLAIKKGRP